MKRPTAPLGLHALVASLLLLALLSSCAYTVAHHQGKKYLRLVQRGKADPARELVAPEYRIQFDSLYLESRMPGRARITRYGLDNDTIARVFYREQGEGEEFYILLQRKQKRWMVILPDTSTN